MIHQRTYVLILYITDKLRSYLRYEQKGEGETEEETKRERKRESEDQRDKKR